MDAPPLLPVTDAAVLTAVTDGAFVVLSTGKTLDTELEAALNHIEAVSGRTLGIVFNRVPRRESEAGYYGGSYRAETTPAARTKAAPAPAGGTPTDTKVTTPAR